MRTSHVMICYCNMLVNPYLESKILSETLQVIISGYLLCLKKEV